MVFSVLLTTLLVLSTTAATWSAWVYSDHTPALHQHGRILLALTLKTIPNHMRDVPDRQQEERPLVEHPAVPQNQTPCCLRRPSLALPIGSHERNYTTTNQAYAAAARISQQR